MEKKPPRKRSFPSECEQQGDQEVHDGNKGSVGTRSTDPSWQLSNEIPQLQPHMYSGRLRSRISSSDNELHNSSPPKKRRLNPCEMCQQKDKQIVELETKCKSLQDNLLPKEMFDDMKYRYEQERAEKDNALMRLSAMASSRLRDNNPNIADLSDENRPTKIAEKFSELYDNQWTDAYDALSGEGMTEEETVQFLLDVLMKAYEQCKSIASDKYLEKVRRFIELPIETSEFCTTGPALSSELTQQIKEFRKSRAPHVVAHLYEALKTTIMTKYDHLPAVQTYAKDCVSLCWLMVVQDPPVVLHDPPSGKLDTQQYKEYTSRGPLIQFVVWPALLLHEGGPLLAKGVAQGGEELTAHYD